MGNVVHVAGTVASNDQGAVVGAGDAYAQAFYILQRIRHYLHAAGAELKDVVRTRMYVTDAALWEQVGKAHYEFFHTIRPVATLVEVSALIGEEYLVEIEVEAIVNE